MTRVKISIDELYPHFVVEVPGEDPERDEYVGYPEDQMYDVDDATLARWKAAFDAFYAVRAELRAKVQERKGT